MARIQLDFAAVIRAVFEFQAGIVESQFSRRVMDTVVTSAMVIAVDNTPLA